MNEISKTHTQLPDTIEDLSKFVLVNEERITALKAQIRAIKKVSLAKEVYEQKLAEAQEIGQITVEAAQKMGELLLQIQKQTGNQYSNSASPRDAEKQKTKTEITSEMGMTSQQVSQYQQMAQNPEAVKAAIQKAIDSGDVVSRSSVMKEIKAIKDQHEKEIALVRSDLEIARNEVKALKDRPAKVVEKEIIPSDYEELKKRVKGGAEDLKTMHKEYDALLEKYQKSEEEKKAMQADTPEVRFSEQLRKDVMYFCGGISKFLKDYGGYTYISKDIDKLPEMERRGYLSAIQAVHEWSETMLDSVTGEVVR